MERSESNYTLEINDLLKTWKKEYDPKLNTLSSFVDDYVKKEREKLIVYAARPKTLEMLSETFKDIKHVKYHGKLNVKDTVRYKNEIQEQFKKDDETKLMLISSLAMSDGGNYQSVCNKTLVYEPDFNAVNYIQLRDRHCRITSVKDSIIWYFNYYKTMDAQRIHTIMNRTKLNNILTKEISEKDLEKFLNGTVLFK
jgi:hypothetical protein